MGVKCQKKKYIYILIFVRIQTIKNDMNKEKNQKKMRNLRRVRN